MKILPVLILCFLASCSLFGHEDSGNDKDKTTQIRDFTWRIDTVGTEFSLGGGIYGFSDDNVFVMGSFYSDEKGTYLRGMRWDGKEWTDDYYIPNIDFNIASNDATGDDTVLVTVGYWAGTSNESIATARYSNITNTWTMYKPDIDGRLLDVWTDSKGFYVAVGFNGLVATSENSGFDWNVSKGVEDYLDDYILQEVNGVSKNDYFVQGSRYNAEHSTYQYALWRVKDGIWMKWIDSVNEEETKSELLFLDEYVGYEFYATKDEDSDTTYLFLSAENSSYKISAVQNRIENVTDFQSVPANSENIDLNVTWIFGTHKDDVWITNSYLDFYQWNGTDLYENRFIEELGISSSRARITDFHQSKSGKIWMLIEAGFSQTYSVLQGTPIK